MSDQYDDYATGLVMSHRALLRSLDVLVRETQRTPELVAFARRYLELLELHHDAEERDLFPLLRRHAAGRSSDAAHLERWDSEHRAIAMLGDEISRDLDKGRSV